MRTITRRRKENKTDYGKRKKLLKSELPRLVFRRTNKYFIVQYVESKESRDKVVFGMDSRKLLNYGWPKELKGSLKSTPSAYFLGLLVGKEILSKKLKLPIVDFGMARTLHKTKIHGFLKGLVDSELKIKTKKETFPEEDRIQGKHLKNFPFETIKSKIKTK